MVIATVIIFSVNGLLTFGLIKMLLQFYRQTNNNSLLSKGTEVTFNLSSCWSTLQIVISNLNPLQNFCSNLCNECLFAYWNDWIALAKIHQSIVNVSAPLCCKISLTETDSKSNSQLWRHSHTKFVNVCILATCAKRRSLINGQWVLNSTHTLWKYNHSDSSGFDNNNFLTTNVVMVVFKIFFFCTSSCFIKKVNMFNVSATCCSVFDHLCSSTCSSLFS